MNKIKELISQKDWGLLISNYSVEDVCSSLSFNDAMHIVEHLFYDDIQDDEKQQYALKLAFKIKEHFKKEWESDWKNDVFLGGLCEMLWLYDERYLCYKRAYDKLKDSPSELLLLLSNCNSAPGKPPITDEESEFYLRQAVDKNLTCEVALAMRSFYRLKEDKSQEEYWDQMYKKLEKENVHSGQIIPDVLK
ncbi:hypothetical protein [Candidatus Protochlamydia phocaeensis]|uniref:hypothetical protein n=1 Tax=Candidatus Protochlamydia phocaeensis TaxID=1414722 RepID=UPI0008383B02|nr:hypothetical protein [Candidatus Protochlamydia phocaeensis]